MSYGNPDGLHLGDHVEDHYGRKGRITDLHHSCPQDEEWIRLQARPVTAAERKERWASILVDGGGAVVVAASRLTKVEPFDLDNGYAESYFADAKVEGQS